MKAQPRRLRFGVMCEDLKLQRWQVETLRSILDLGSVDLELVITPRARRSRRSRLKALKLHQVLFLLYRRFLVHARAAERVDARDMLDGAPRMSCRVTRHGRLSQYFSDEDVRTIRERNLDFILRFGFGVIRGEILSSARYGVWSFHHDDPARYRGRPPCFWEIYLGDPVTGAVLQRLTDRLDGGVLLREGHYKTQLHSYAANLDEVFLRSVRWPADVCRDILRGEDEYLSALPATTPAPIYTIPNNLQTLRFVSRVARNYVRWLARRVFLADEWNIGLSAHPIASFLDGRQEIEWLSAPRLGTFIADPFGLHGDGGLELFYEAYDYLHPKGSIRCSTLMSDCSRSRSRVALEQETHLSYPYLIEHEGGIYMIPESFEANEIALYKATEFPLGWEKAATLVPDFAGVDATVFQHDDCWWMLCTNEDHGPNDRLWIFHAPDLFGPWEPHLGNPVKTDIRCTRPAGTPFVHHGQLYRPTQDCSITYGGGVALNRVTRLDTQAFQEETVRWVYPDRSGPYPDGMHHLARIGNMTLVDGKRIRFVPSALAYTLRKHIGRLLGKDREA